MKKYKFAIRVYSTDLAFVKTKRTIDFLLDGKTITRENTVFIAEDAISDDYRNEFSRRYYDLVEIKKIPLRELMTPSLIKAVLTLNNNNILRAYEEAAWNAILKKISFDHFICYNDTSPAHVFRNRVLKQHGVVTWYYNHSSDYAYLYEKGDGKVPYPLYDKDKEIYQNLEYDRMICWNRNQEEFFKKLGSRIGEYIITGCLWSQHIEKKKSRPATIGVFDTSVKGDQLPNTEKDMTKFYDGVIRLKTDYPEYRFIVKTKNVIEPSAHLRDIYDDLVKRNVFTISKDLEPSSVIEDSAIIICAPFTSIAVEAMEAGIPAIYYDASDKWRGTYYDKQGIVAHNYAELHEMVSQRLKTEAGDTCNRGIDRFREALITAGN